MFTDYNVSSYDIGDGLGHFTISTQDVSRPPTLIFRCQSLIEKFFVPGLQNG